MNLNLPVKSLVCCAAYDKGDSWQINPSKYKGLGPNCLRLCFGAYLFWINGETIRVFTVGNLPFELG